MVTDYMEGKVGGRVALMLRFHTLICPNCKRHVLKMRTMVSSMSGLPNEGDIPDNLQHMIDDLSE